MPSVIGEEEEGRVIRLGHGQAQMILAPDVTLDFPLKPYTQQSFAPGPNDLDFQRYIEYHRDYKQEAKRMQHVAEEESLRNDCAIVHGSVNFDDPGMPQILETVQEKARDTHLVDPMESQFKDQIQDKKIGSDPSDGESLVLPRYHHTSEFSSRHSIIQACESETLSITMSEMEENTPAICSSVSALHVYDPMVELALKPPYIIFVNKKDDVEIPKIVCVRVLQLMCQFPLGITPQHFWKTFELHNNYEVSVPSCAKDSITQRLRKEITFYEVDKKQLMFPRYMEGVLTPEKILIKFWHLLRNLICIEGSYIKVSKLLPLMKNTYGFEFDPFCWGYDTISQFLKFVVVRFESTGIVIHRIECSVNDRVQWIDYIMLNSKPIMRALDYKHGIYHDTPSNPKPKVPEGFLSEISFIDSIANHISRDDVRICHIRVINNRNWFVVILEEDLVRKQKFEMDLQTNLLPMFKSEALIPDPSLLCVGMLVMANIGKNWKTPGTWYRARILWKDMASQKYMVYKIDHGGLECVELRSMRYMPKIVVAQPAYAVPVKLDTVPKEMPMAETKKMLRSHIGRMIRSKCSCLRIRFIRSEQEIALGCRIWTVKCDATERNSKTNVYTTTVYDIDTYFMKKYRQALSDKQRRPEVEV